MELEENIYLVDSSENLSSIPAITLIDNSTYCFDQDIFAYVRCFFSNMSR